MFIFSNGGGLQVSVNFICVFYVRLDFGLGDIFIVGSRKREKIRVGVWNVPAIATGQRIISETFDHCGRIVTGLCFSYPRWAILASKSCDRGSLKRSINLL